MARKKSKAGPRSGEKTWVSLFPGAKLPFRRAKRDENGIVTEVYRFEPSNPLELESEAFGLVRNDIGRTLCICVPVKDEEGRFRVDQKATNDVHMECHETHIPKRVGTKINVGASSEPPEVVQPPQEPDADGGEGDEGGKVELSDELVELLEKNHDKFVELSPDGVKAFLDEGNKLEDLEGFDDAKAKELREALGLE